MTRNEIIKTIDEFIDGSSGDAWTWDDFVSVRYSNKKVESVRQEIIEIDRLYPATEMGWWCSADGLKALEALSMKLKSETW